MELFNIFYVNKGQLFAIDPQSPNVCIKNLQPQIRQFTGIRNDDQVLIISGGEALDSDKRLGDCKNFGTTANPVFLFQRPSKHNSLEVNVEQEINELNRVVDDVIDQNNALSNGDVKAIYMELPNRARSSKEAGNRCVQACIRMVQEHHLLVKGWSALVANVDDNVSRVKRKTVRHKTNIEKVREQSEKATMILQDFDKCLHQLQQINIPPALLAHSRGSKDCNNTSEQSMYDWISQFDQNFSLQVLVENVREQFQQYGETSGTEICSQFDGLYTHSRKEAREIKGINVRFSQLEQNLETADKYCKDIEKRVQMIIQSSPITDPYAMQERVSEQMTEMEHIQKLLKELKKISGLFHKSKVELLGNLRQRLTGWTVSCYEMLHLCATEIMVFEEKFNGIKNRLEIIHQIKETPILYVTAVCEVIRRAALQKEFTIWHKQHVDRCTSFAKTEEEIRSQIANKLKNHFLRVLFPGIFDKFPEFFVKNLPKYDEELPPVSPDYIRQLRQGVKELETFLKVTSPQVFSKLCVRDSSASIISPSGASMIRREESFFTADSTMNIATMNKNFPSTTWLGGLDGFDNSPSIQPAISLGMSPPSRTGSATSMNIPVTPSLNQLSMLAEQEEVPNSILGKSAPINIPLNMNTHEVSEKSSHFSTPEDNFTQQENESSEEMRDDGSSQFQVDDLNTRSQQSLEVLKSVLEEVAKISKGLLDVRADVINRRDEFVKDFENIASYSSQLTDSRMKEEEGKFAERIKEMEDLTQKLKDELREKSTALTAAEHALESYKFLDSEKDFEIKEANETIESLKLKIGESEEKAKEVEKDIFKRLTIEYELQGEKFRQEAAEIVEQKEKELKNLKKELERKNSEIELLRSDPDSENYRKHVTTEIRADLEKEFKSKSELISKGMMRQKDEALARNKKEYEYELKQIAQKNKNSTKFLMLERDRLRDLVSSESAEEIKKEVQEKLDELNSSENTTIHFPGLTVGTQTEKELTTPSSLPGNLMFSTYGSHGPSPPMMMESQFIAMEQSTVQLQSSSEENKESHEIHRSDDKTVDCTVQTRISMKSMELMVAVQDIWEGSTVLVVWSERHNAYMLFSSSSYLHFVKESSVRRLGLSMAEGSRRNWIFGRVLHLDLCMIRKPTNRYNLPVDTRVYRVDVDNVPIEVRNRDNDPI